MQVKMQQALMSNPAMSHMYMVGRCDCGIVNQIISCLTANVGGLQSQAPLAPARSKLLRSPSVDRAPSCTDGPMHPNGWETSAALRLEQLWFPRQRGMWGPLKVDAPKLKGTHAPLPPNWEL